MPRRSATCDADAARDVAHGRVRRRHRRRARSRQQMNERPRVARFGRQILAVAARDHRRDRVRIDREHHEHVADAEHDEQQHRQEVPVARPHVAAEQVRERRELHRFPDRDARDDGHDADDRHREVRHSLQRVVLALARMILSHREIEPHHLPRRRARRRAAGRDRAIRRAGR